MPTSLLDRSRTQQSEGVAEWAPSEGEPVEERDSGEDRDERRSADSRTRVFGNMSIRLKVIWITVVPLAAMFLFSGVLARSVLDEAQSAGRIQDFARLGNESSTLVDTLQAERSAAAAYVTSPGTTASHPPLRDFVDQGREVDEGLRRFFAEYDGLDEDITRPISSEYEQVRRGYDVLSIASQPLSGRTLFSPINTRAEGVTL